MKLADFGAVRPITDHGTDPEGVPLMCSVPWQTCALLVILTESLPVFTTCVSLEHSVPLRSVPSLLRTHSTHSTLSTECAVPLVGVDREECVRRGEDGAQVATRWGLEGPDAAGPVP